MIHTYLGDPVPNLEWIDTLYGTYSKGNLTLMNNFAVTKKFLITKFDCITILYSKQKLGFSYLAFLKRFWWLSVLATEPAELTEFFLTATAETAESLVDGLIKTQSEVFFKRIAAKKKYEIQLE